MNLSKPAARNFQSQGRFLVKGALPQTLHARIQKLSNSFCEILLKLHFKLELDPRIHSKRALFFPKSGHFFLFLRKTAGETSPPLVTHLSLYIIIIINIIGICITMTINVFITNPFALTFSIFIAIILNYFFFYFLLIFYKPNVFTVNNQKTKNVYFFYEQIFKLF